MRKSRKANTEYLTGYTLASRGIPPLFPSEPAPGAREIDLTGCVLTVDVMPADVIPTEGRDDYKPSRPAIVAFPMVKTSRKTPGFNGSRAVMALYI